MGIKMDREEAEAWRDYFWERDEKHYNEILKWCNEYVKNNRAEFIKFTEDILNEIRKDIPILREDRSYLSIDDMERWRKGLKEVLLKNKLTLVYKVVEVE